MHVEKERDRQAEDRQAEDRQTETISVTLIEVNQHVKLLMKNRDMLPF